MDRAEIRHAGDTQGEGGEDVVRRLLPEHWVVRRVWPRHHLDLQIEVVDPLPDGSGWAPTAGEQVYARVKTDTNPARYDATARPRGNAATFHDRSGVAGAERAVPVISIPMDTREIAAVEAMGASVPVLLFWVDLPAEAAYWVCMNDYITKVLLPENPDYRSQGRVGIRVPVRNRLDATSRDAGFFRLLARRSKLFSAFTLFGYQFHELDMIVRERPSRGAVTESGTSEMIETFVTNVTRLDIWERRGGGYWAPLEDIRAALYALRTRLAAAASLTGDDLVRAEQAMLHHAWETFGAAANLARTYEEIVREWYLPTFLAEEIADAQGRG